MKKIMGAVLAAAMLAGTVTAADVGFSYTGANLFSVANGSSDKIPLFLGRRDCVSVSLVTEAAGVVVDYDVDANVLGRDEYYGWLNFGLPVGSLQVTAGVWNGRNVNRVLTDRFDLDALGSSNVTDSVALFELHKPGVINGTWGYDSSNLTLGKLGLVGAWTLADALPGTLMVKFGLVEYNNTTAGIGPGSWKPGNWNPNKDSFNVIAGFVAEASYRQEGAFGATFSARSFNKNSYSFGAWITPELADTLQMTIGGTVATGKKYNNGWSDRLFEYGIDFRLRLQVTDDLSLTTMNNLSAGYAKNYASDGPKTGMLWNMLNATYAFADNLKASFTVNSEADVFCPVANDKNDTNWTLYITPSLIIQASERTRVSAKIPKVRNYAFKHIELTVPVALSFNY